MNLIKTIRRPIGGQGARIAATLSGASPVPALHGDRPGAKDNLRAGVEHRLRHMADGAAA